MASSLRESKRALEKLVLGKKVRLETGKNDIDRHGRLLAHLYAPDGVWVQGEMLKSGMARVYTFPDNRIKAAEMLALEGRARKTGLGIWGHPFYAVRDGARPVELHKRIGTFQVIEGRIKAAAKVKSRIYLNFGADWRTDFTVAVRTRAAKLFKGAGVDLEALSGRRVRVRGWLKSRNGPTIEATHPEQIEVLAVSGIK